VGSRAAARNAEKWVGLAQLLLLFPSLPVVTPTVTYKRRIKTQAVEFIWLFFFLPVCFSFADDRSSSGGLLRTLLGCC
jgi:hypothetical protein